MPRRKNTVGTMLDTKGAKIGEPVPKAIVDINTASVGVPRQAEQDLRTELSALRQQVDRLQQQVISAGRSAKGGAGMVVRETGALAKHYPLSTFALIAAVAGLSAFASRQLSLPRHRGPSALRELRDFYGRMRDWI
ncbi:MULTISPECIES: hypothetical protein [unclassified Rhizobium]|uniref:hypothetical protein n=1 Tax=unclassified Rhizobium TaxID=2613769 RepID=UPI0007EA02C3|nr:MULTISPECIES: hypothetical protein [unclassified Rhizobium]ANK88823.1 hypothetical protein AMK02_PD00204 [Rhizobium sp. N731]ANL19076.1 hypothetical protein AMJ97_PD00205 [Rhizobium sp. N1314]ARO27765.1 hypothetical protein TAL182_PE00213 [Rhizobium sp. TAL182]PDS99651.1 hypothetical protein CO659_02410 [Rhizobium sp. S9]